VELSKLQHCLVVTELGSFTRAAAQLAVPQSVLSRQVRDVEQWLGLRLLHRTGRGAVLTESGARMLPLLRTLIADGERLLQEARTLQSTPSGLVRLGMLTSLCPVLLTPLLTLASERLPEVRIHVVEGLADHLDELLLSGRLDLGVLYGNRHTPSPTDEALLQTDLYLIGAAGDPHTRATTVDLARLAGLPLTLPALPNRMRLAIDQACREHGVQLIIAAALDAIGTMKEIAASGRSHTLLPLHFVARDVAAGRLQAARIVNPAISRTVLLATATQGPVSRACAEVAALIREVTATLVRSGELRGRMDRRAKQRANAEAERRI
jgi:LysR family transcriptional regulator, nitrogen assimilation regulatory protein